MWAQICVLNKNGHIILLILLFSVLPLQTSHPSPPTPPPLPRQQLWVTVAGKKKNKKTERRWWEKDKTNQKLRGVISLLPLTIPDGSCLLSPPFSLPPRAFLQARRQQEEDTQRNYTLLNVSVAWVTTLSVWRGREGGRGSITLESIVLTGNGAELQIKWRVNPVQPWFKDE